jgi:hypothetical protein
MMPGKSLRRLKEVRRIILFCVRGLPPPFQGCASEFYSPGPRVTRTEDSRHREYEVPTSQHPSLHSHPFIPAAPCTRSGLGLLAVLPIAYTGFSKRLGSSGSPTDFVFSSNGESYSPCAVSRVFLRSYHICRTNMCFDT